MHPIFLFRPLPGGTKDEAPQGGAVTMPASLLLQEPIGNPSGDGSLWRAQIHILSKKQWNVEVSKDWGVPMLRQGIEENLGLFVLPPKQKHGLTLGRRYLLKRRRMKEKKRDSIEDQCVGI
ncbi:hypothetical protein SLEP1_g41345 [Rubroshorea leprosula]|uniref:Uncharacterized protein n=1 Tax=Rubroshorea leprosula TaxID=152421 RepID=A0AAV5L6B6_9ROSI|nr:hypothetical protein SLEP1_g41345 [Rubroshorea leprosula]